MVVVAVAILAKQPKEGTANLNIKRWMGKSKPTKECWTPTTASATMNEKRRKRNTKLDGDWWTIWWRFAGNDDSKTP